MQTIKNYCAVGLLFSLIVAQLVGCGQNAPFEYTYTSPDSVEIRYQDKTYQISRAGGPDNLPFTYAFETDGDVDLVLNGETYELESPYDVDGSLKKKSTGKKTKRKTSSRRSSPR
ncbi:MAG: hypothetical protein ACOY32_04495 [Thermodesulfobacteriota bacterium]